MKRALIHIGIRSALAVYGAALAGARLVRRQPRPIDEGGCDILLTGMFQSNSWVEHHLRPLALAASCRSVTLVATTPLAPMDKVSVVQPPRWLIRVAGSAGARLLVFTALALRRRPHIVGGFHLLFNGLTAALVAPLAGARSLYFCVGGPAEVLDGGIRAENKLFNRLETADPVVERQLVRATASFDTIITMGTSAAAFLRERGARGEIHVIPGGLDPDDVSTVDPAARNRRDVCRAPGADQTSGAPARRHPARCGSFTPGPGHHRRGRRASTGARGAIEPARPDVQRHVRGPPDGRSRAPAACARVHPHIGDRRRRALADGSARLRRARQSCRASEIWRTC